MIDARREGLLNGLRQLTVEQLERVRDYKGPMVLDHWNYHEGRYCPLAVGLGLDKLFREPTHEKVSCVLHLMGYTTANSRGRSGEFYTTDRETDLKIAVREVIQEREQRANERD